MTHIRGCVLCGYNSECESEFDCQLPPVIPKSDINSDEVDKREFNNEPEEE